VCESVCERIELCECVCVREMIKRMRECIALSFKNTHFRICFFLCREIPITIVFRDHR